MQQTFGYGNIFGIRIDSPRYTEDLTTLFGNDYARNTVQLTKEEITNGALQKTEFRTFVMKKVVEVANLYGKYERSKKIPVNEKLKSAWEILGECDTNKKLITAKTGHKTSETPEEKALREDRTFRMYRSEQDKRLVDYLNNFTWKISAALFVAVFIALVLLDSELEPGDRVGNSTKLRSTLFLDKS